MARVENFDPDPQPSFDQDGLYEKYRVFREPSRDSQGAPVSEHPVPLTYPTFETSFTNRGGEEVSIVTELPEITDEFLFVLKPATDPHAKVAIAAYAESVRRERPQLWADLMDLLSDDEWKEGSGDVEET